MAIKPKKQMQKDIKQTREKAHKKSGAAERNR